MSRRISLATIRDGRVWASFNEGEYHEPYRGKRGIELAIEGAKVSAADETYWSRHGFGEETHIAVISFPITFAKPPRIIAKFPIRGVVQSGECCPKCGQVKP